MTTLNPNDQKVIPGTALALQQQEELKKFSTDTLVQLRLGLVVTDMGSLMMRLKGTAERKLVLKWLIELEELL